MERHDNQVNRSRQNSATRSRAAVSLIVLSVVLPFVGPKQFGSCASFPNSIVGGRFGHSDGGPDHLGCLAPVPGVWWTAAVLLLIAAALLVSMTLSRRSLLTPVTE